MVMKIYWSFKKRDVSQIDKKRLNFANFENWGTCSSAHPGRVADIFI